MWFGYSSDRFTMAGEVPRSPDYDGIVAFSQTDFTEDLKKITVRVLVMHADDDQIVPTPIPRHCRRNC